MGKGEKKVGVGGRDRGLKEEEKKLFIRYSSGIRNFALKCSARD